MKPDHFIEIEVRGDFKLGVSTDRLKELIQKSMIKESVTLGRINGVLTQLDTDYDTKEPIYRFELRPTP